MIGNDVVDLNLAKIQSNWRRSGFLSKVFTKNEQTLIFGSADHNQMVWRLWTMKEAAYKAHQRQFDLESKLNPIAFECSLLSGGRGRVHTDSGTYKTQTTKCLKFIYSEAKAIGLHRTVYSELKSNASENIKDALGLYLSQQINRSPAQFKIRKCKNGIPWIFVCGKKQEIPFSISHHGRFSIFSCFNFVPSKTVL